MQFEIIISLIINLIRYHDILPHICLNVFRSVPTPAFLHQQLYYFLAINFLVLFFQLDFLDSFLVLYFLLRYLLDIVESCERYVYDWCAKFKRIVFLFFALVYKKVFYRGNIVEFLGIFFIIRNNQILFEIEKSSIFKNGKIKY